METPICDLCGQAESSKFQTVSDRLSGMQYHLYTCSQCGTLFLNPRPTQSELDDFYQQDYEPYHLDGSKQTKQNETDLLNALKLQLTYLEKSVSQPGKLLDIGCATGRFLHFAQQHGWKVLGIEPVEEAARVAREVYSLEVISEPLETAGLPEGEFDAITLWDVLEHMPSPSKALQRCWQLLKPGGVVVFSIPNLRSLDRYLFGGKWIGWDPPRHFYLFPTSALELILEKSQLDLEDLQCIGGGKGTFFLSLDTVLRNTSFSTNAKKLYPLLGAALWPYRKLSYLIRRGPILTGTARKIG